LTSAPVFVSDYRLQLCLGCKQCFVKGEAYCPLKDDDRDVLLQKMEQSDGIVFATPTYAFGVAARMKNLFDRLAFIDHRPRFFGKASIAIVTQGDIDSYDG
jgi:multimeric flavodoxin WrbA